MVVAELALESVLLRAVHSAVLSGLALKYREEDAGLLDLMAELAAGRHDTILRTKSMLLQAQVRLPFMHPSNWSLRLTWHFCTVPNPDSALYSNMLCIQLKGAFFSCLVPIVA